MKPHSKTTPAMRLSIYQRHLAGEKQNVIAHDLGLSRQLVSIIIGNYREAAAEGKTAPGRKRRNLAKEHVTEFTALRLLVLGRAPAELGVVGFRKWNYRALQQLTLTLFKLRLMRPEAEALLQEWEVPCEIGPTGPDGYIPAAGAPPRRGFETEALPAAYHDYMASPTGRRISAGIAAHLARGREARLAAGTRGWPMKKRGRHFTSNAHLHQPSLIETNPMNSPTDIAQRLAAARTLIGDAAVQKVIDHYARQ